MAFFPEEIARSRQLHSPKYERYFRNERYEKLRWIGLMISVVCMYHASFIRTPSTVC